MLASWLALFEHLAYLGSLGLSNTLLLLCFWLTLGFSDFAATPLAFSWDSPASAWYCSLGLDMLLMLRSWLPIGTSSTLLVFFILLTLAGFPTLSLCFVLGHASTLLTLRSWFYLERFFFCFFLWRIKLQHALDATLLALSWTSLAHSWCYVLGSGSDTLLMLRAEPSLGTVPDALDATVHHNCDNTLLTFSWNFHSALVGATLRLLTLRSGDSHALGATLLALFWTTQARTL